MYKIDDFGSTYASLPPNLQDVDNDCFSYALDRQMQKLHILAKQLTVWSNLDNVPAKYYDYIAICLNAPYYRSEYSDEQKLKLIKSAIETVRFAGTQSAINLLTESIFSEAVFEAWYEYSGSPYHFRIRTDEILTPDINDRFLEIIERAKSARSVLDAIEIRRQIDETARVGIGTSLIRKPAAIKECYIPLTKQIKEVANIGADAGYIRIPPAITEITVGEVN